MANGVYTSSARTLANGEGADPSLDVTGAIIVAPAVGASFGASSADGSTFTRGTTTGGIAMGVYEASAPTITTGKAAAVGIDVNANLKATLATALAKTIDSVSARPEPTSPLNVTATGVISAIPCILVGMYVNSTSSGTAKLYDNASAASGTVLNNTITPDVGYHPLGNALCVNGVYATIGGTLDVTFYFINV